MARLTGTTRELGPSGTLGGGRQVCHVVGNLRGIDMALAVIGRRYGGDAAEAIAVAMEYEWHRDPLWDPFAQIAAKGSVLI